ncbi:MAG: hypothetical protein E7082_07280 [Bacteroidales bacterium]|nr:hypothetical protein [Bacteroidales bacterium]
MNTNDSITFPEFHLTPDEEEKICRLAYTGMPPNEIAVAMGWPMERRRAFLILAEIPASPLAMMLDAAFADGTLELQLKLKNAVLSGNIEAIRELQKLQGRNRFKSLINYLDDDEFTP